MCYEKRVFQVGDFRVIIILMSIREELKYTESHEWIRQEGNEVFIGITDYFQEALGDIVFVEIPEIRQEIARNDEVLNIESVKVAKALYSPLSGRINRVNNLLREQPDMLNKDPYGVFLYSIKMSHALELSKYMDASAYRQFIQGQNV